MDLYKKVSAQVVLLNPEGLILGVSRKDDHNSFGLIGGKMDAEDYGNPLITAKREAKEETGLTVCNLQLIFAIHKGGFMSYTYLGDYYGEIKYDEPHVVAWIPMERLILGSFGEYNKMVASSLSDMGVSYVYDISMDEVKDELKNFVDNNLYNGEQFFYSNLTKNYGWFGTQLMVHMVGKDGRSLDEELEIDEKFLDGLRQIGEKYGFKYTRIPSDYFHK